MEILKERTVDNTVQVWENQLEKTTAQMSCCCYCGD